ncbi:MAG: beta-galactosidase [Bacteroidota bacterium]|nr:beta-galactosidase [Bacteroidota bacterium]
MRKLYLLLLLMSLAFTVTVNAQKRADYFPQSQLITTGVYYYPEHWDSTQWERDFRNMAAMGFEFTHFAEFAWAQLEPKEGKYDFAWLDKALALAAKYNLKVIMCTSTCTPPVWLVRKHPSILLLDENGVREDHGSRQAASFSSNYYRQYSLKMVAELAKHYGKDSRIVGWQIDNEPTSYFDYNPDAQQRFRDWLKNRYGTIDALNKTWGTSFWSQTYSDFSEINIPEHKQWGMNLNQRLDHYRFVASETSSFLDDQAREIKKYASPRQWITSNYIPSYGCGYIGASKELDFLTYTRYMVYGEDQGVGPKGYRLGDPYRIAMSNDFFRPLSPYYGVMELQPGQVNWGRINPQPLPGAVRLWLWHQFAGGSKLVCTYRYRAPLTGYEQYHYGIVGTDGVTPTTGGLEYQKFIQEVNLLRKDYTLGTKLPSGYLARKTAILFNHENIWGMDMNKQTDQWNSLGHISKYYNTLKSFGAPVDFIVDSSDFLKYPVLIAPAYQQIDKALIDKLTSYVKAGGNLVLTCRTGHKDHEMHLWEAKFAAPIYDLIGSEIESFDLPMPQSQDSVLMDNKTYAWKTWGELLKPLPGTEVWATYQGEFYAGKPAVITRKLGKGTVTYVGVDSNKGLLEKEVLKKLYNRLNIPVENYPEGVTVEYRDGFGIGVNYGDKKYQLNIPDDAQILIGTKELPTAGVAVWKLK